MSLRVEGIWKSYDERPVLRGLDLEVAPGEVYGLVGPNGCGKSTFLQVVAGLLATDRGRVLDGASPPLGIDRARMGFVPQEPALYPRLSCVETLRFFGHVYGVARRDLPGRIESAIRATGLGLYRTARTETLSGGWRQRLSLAAALVHEPELLVLDEPTTGLDVQVRDAVWALVGSLASKGAAVLLSSHSLEEAESHCHRVGILDGGRIVAEGSPAALRRRVPAAQVAEVEAADAGALLERSREHGWGVRTAKGRWLLFLPESTTLPEVAAELTGLPIRSLSLRSANLEDVFREVVEGSGAQPVGENAETGNIVA